MALKFTEDFIEPNIKDTYCIGYNLYDNNLTLLHKLVFFPPLLRNLLQYDKNINVCTTNGYTPLMIACINNLISSVQILLQQDKVNLNLQNNDGQTALMLACYYNNKAIIKLLLQYIDLSLELNSINIQDNNGDTVLIYLCLHNYYEDCFEILKLLLQNKELDINLQNKYGKTALMCACYADINIENIKLLINNGADINLLDNRKRSALHYAIDNGNIEYEVLLYKHPDFNIKLNNLKCIPNKYLFKFLDNLDIKDIPSSMYNYLMTVINILHNILNINDNNIEVLKQIKIINYDVNNLYTVLNNECILNIINKLQQLQQLNFSYDKNNKEDYTKMINKIKELTKLKQFDYNSILLYEVKKLI